LQHPKTATEFTSSEIPPATWSTSGELSVDEIAYCSVLEITSEVSHRTSANIIRETATSFEKVTHFSFSQWTTIVREHYLSITPQLGIVQFISA
jgi:hypothetical protein